MRALQYLAGVSQAIVLAVRFLHLCDNKNIAHLLVDGTKRLDSQEISLTPDGKYIPAASICSSD